MAFSSNSSGGAMADMNVTPLVDVMLVLLIIFMVTAPPMTYQIQVDLPQNSRTPPPPVENPPEPIRIHVQTGGTVAWNGSPVPMGSLQAQFDVEGARDVQPTIEITTDPDAEYETLAKVLARTKNAGLQKISFVEEAE
ncbi:biopolymer transport protein exbD2 [Arenimonas maotaiensis]|uniref:Biopolymer transport protein exbD2 n=1 Tax=Arenimonas maotaiensis TaxID=1446479 RepID=A0A917CPR3_9GAMM|nr:biopolymer transporter ExbD [Arenimonas maotaiensis]GGF94610.1 biopolymer transport protein exbD2 [Arenimonas maotaiensis]